MLPQSDGTIDLGIARMRMRERERRAVALRKLRGSQRMFLAPNVRELGPWRCCTGPEVA